MTDYTAEEVRRTVECEYDWEELEWDLKHPYKDDPITITLRDEPVPLEYVDSYTGEEGDYSTETFIIFRVGDQMFRQKGRYGSYNGNEWNGPFEEVEQRPKTVLTYEPKS